MRRAGITLLVTLAACAHEPPRPNVVVIVMDTARPDYLSAYGHAKPTTPFLERFAKTAERYDRAYSTSCWTLPAHASLFSGTLPEVHGAGQGDTHVRSDLPLLAERLQKSGYGTACFSNNVWISKEYGLDRGFDHVQDRWRDGLDRASDAGGHATVASLESWLRAEHDNAEPRFVFVNLIEPHMPYRPPWPETQPFLASREEWDQGGAALFPRGKSPMTTTVRHYSRRAELAEAEWTRLRGLYEGELRVTDAIVEQLVERIDAHLDPKNTLVFVLSDHGENLGDHDHLSHIFNLYDSNLRIALLARGPGFAPGAVEQRLVQITDLYPTILRAAGLVPERGLPAIDLRAPLPEKRLLHASLDYPKITLGTFPEELRKDGGPLDRYKQALSAAISTRYKLIRGSDGTSEVYDLSIDPNEQRPLKLADLDEATRKGLEAFLDVTAQGARSGNGSGPRMPTDPATIEALRELGYTQ